MAVSKDTVVVSGQTALELGRELTFILQRVMDRLDALEGIRGDGATTSSVPVAIEDDDGETIHSLGA